MKKIMSILTASLFVVALSSCGGDDSSGSGSESVSGSDVSGSGSGSGSESVSGSDVSGSGSGSIYDKCLELGLTEMNKDPRPEFFDELKIPSNEDMTECVCNKIVVNYPNMTNEELREWWSKDADPKSKEVEEQEKMAIALYCMGFDSFEDYVSAIREMQMKNLEK